MPTGLFHVLLVGGAGFLGAVTRYFVQMICLRWFGAGFPVGTMLINLSGSCFLGWFLTMAAGRWNVSDGVRLAIGTGFVGAYTTFSTWAWESSRQLELKEYWAATFNLVGSLVLGLLAVRLGVWMAGK